MQVRAVGAVGVLHVVGENANWRAVRGCSERQDWTVMQTDSVGGCVNVGMRDCADQN